MCVERVAPKLRGPRDGGNLNRYVSPIIRVCLWCLTAAYAWMLGLVAVQCRTALPRFEGEFVVYPRFHPGRAAGPFCACVSVS